jgi:hypothetical protein
MIMKPLAFVVFEDSDVMCLPVHHCQSIYRQAKGWKSGVRFTRTRGFSQLTASKPALGPTQTPIQWAQGALSPGVKLPGHEAHHSPSTSADIKNGGALPALTYTYSWRCA